MKRNRSYGERHDLNLKTLIALSRSFQSVRKRELCTILKGGLTLSQFGVLEILYHKGALRISEIIAGTLSTGGCMTVVIDNLQREGLVTRNRDPNDGRVSLISITPKGAERIEAVFPDHVKNVSEIFDVLSAEEKGHLNALLKKLQAGAG